MLPMSLLEKLMAQGVRLSLDEEENILIRGDRDNLTTELITEIKELKTELVSILLRNRRQKLNLDISLADRSKNIPLSFGQQRLWFLDKINGSAQYNIPAAIKLSGSLNESVLEKVFTAIVERHESLRTCFAKDDDGQPYQVFKSASGFEVSKLDISSLEPSQREQRAIIIMGEESAREFDLANDFMLKVTLLKVEHEEFILLITMHHIAADGWSMGILIKEFYQLYEAFKNNREDPLQPLAIQYADYAYWQRNSLQREVLNQKIKYWQTQLAGIPVIHSLPLDYPRPKVQATKGRILNSFIDLDVVKALKQLCKLQEATLFMALHAAFSVLLSRYSNETDIVVGTPIANREQREVVDLIGFFANNLVLRSDLSGKPSFIQVLAQSKSILLEAYDHQQVPFESIVDKLRPPRNLSHSPVFQIMLALQNNEGQVFEVPEMSTRSLAQEGEVTVRYDLMLNIVEHEDGLALAWEYSSDLFKIGKIDRLAMHFKLLLKSLVSTPQENVYVVEMLSEKDRYKQLSEWNATQIDYPKEKCIHQLFEEKAASNPDAIAVIFASSRLTYNELNQRSNQLANYLIKKRGVVPDTLVGICVERSLEMLIGILGILKAGAAYVPLDPAYPKARLSYLMEDANLDTILIQHKLKGYVPVADDQAVYFDSETMLTEIQAYSNDNVIAGALNSSHLAYVIYTSGSTGHPKGVMIEHSSVVNLLHGMQKKLDVAQDDNILAAASISFDMHVMELFLPLVSQAILVIATPEQCKDARELKDVLLAEDITIMQATPATWKLLLACGWSHNNQNQRTFKALCGGEAWAEDLSEKLMESGKLELWNMYGPTEATVWSSCSQVKSRVHIGRPINNTRMYVLSKYLSLSPPGCIGELYITGAGLARGYLNRPDLTNEKFIENPFSDTYHSSSGKRLYKTGDLVRYLPDGNLEYIGRIDHQVKVRGFRIELGEIESQLLLHSDVNEAVVVSLPTDEGEQRLVAYVTHDEAASMLDYGEKADKLRFDFIDSIKVALGQTLPVYMIPSIFMVLESLPLTPNGKVDRKALPALDMSLQQKKYVAPTTEIESILCSIWQVVLGVTQVGVTDNYFELGGDSFNLMLCIHQVGKHGVELSAKDFYQHQTIEKLAKISVKSSKETQDHAPFSGDTSLSSAQHWFLNNIHKPEREGGPRIFTSKKVNVDMYRAALERILQLHDGLRAKFSHRNDKWVQTIVPIEELRDDIFSFCDISTIPQHKQASHIVKDLVEKTDAITLECPPLLNVNIYYCGEEDGYIVSWYVHHLISDMRTISIITEDFQDCLFEMTSGNEYRLLSDSLSFPVYLEKIEEYVRLGKVEGGAEYLLGLPWEKRSKIAVDFPENLHLNNYASYSSLEYTLCVEDTNRIKNTLFNISGVSLINALISALVQTFSDKTGNSWLALTVLDGGRNIDIDGCISRTVGWLACGRSLILASKDCSNIDAVQQIDLDIKSVPENGLGRPMLKMFHPDENERELIESLPNPEIGLNYLGITSSDIGRSPPSDLVAAINESLPYKTWVEESNNRSEKVLVEARVENGQLKMRWEYSSNLHKRTSIEAMAGRVANFLTNL